VVLEEDEVEVDAGVEGGVLVDSVFVVLVSDDVAASLVVLEVSFAGDLEPRLSFL
jgi:hypothetical protein